MRKIFFLFIIVVILVVFSGCSSTSKSDSTSSSDNENTSSSTAKEGIKIGINTDPTTLDPFVYSTTVDRILIKNIFNSLTSYDLDSLEINNELAKNIELSEDGLTYTIEIQDGVVFHNDKQLTTDDVKYSLEEAMKPEASRTASLLEHIDSIEVLDDIKFEIKLKQRDIDFLHSLADVHIAPNDDSIDHQANPIGTGPFVFQEWKHNEVIRLAKNDNYWKGDLPKLSSVEFRSIPDSSVKLMQLKNSQVDLIDRVPLSDVEALQSEGNVELNSIDPQVAISTHFLLMNNSKSPFNDKKFRQAVNYALNRQGMEDAMFGSFLATSSPVPETNSHYNPNITSYEMDVEKAKKLLEESVYDGEEVELLFHPIDTAYDMVAQFTEQSLKQIGINVKLSSVEIAQWTENVFDQKDYDLALTGIVPKPSIIDLLNHPFGKINGESIQWQNDAWYDKLVEAKEADPEKSEQLIQELQEEVLEESPSIIIGKNIEFTGSQLNVSGFKPHPQGALMLEEVEMQ